MFDNCYLFSVYSAEEDGQGFVRLAVAIRVHFKFPLVPAHLKHITATPVLSVSEPRLDA